MNLLWKQILQCWTLGVLIPGMFFSTAAFYSAGATQLPEQEISVQQPQIQDEPEPSQPVLIPVLQEDGEVEQMELEEYICRVVLGEVPASFELEALKAQAVAARTYTLRCVLDGGRHPEGAVCTDYRCCQAYQEPENYLLSGGTEENVSRIQGAVEATRGQAIYYDGELIYATYFASSGGSTEDAEEVWGQAFPYLTVVSSPGEEDTAYYAERTTYTAQEFQDLLGVTLTGAPEEWFGKVLYTVGGGVDSIRIGAKRYSGVDIRSIFGLRSTIFTISTTQDSITFETKGYGHRVGMSQYGADAMAVAGNSFDEILLHYYPGTSLAVYPNDSD